jgi:hypothetical protein
MSNNTHVINPDKLAARGDLIATDDVSGVKYQRIKVGTGSAGAYDGDVTTDNPFPVSDSTIVEAFGPSSTARDAFGRNRVSAQQVLGYGSFEYGLKSDYVETATNGAGAVANLVNESSISLTNGGGTSGHYAYAATRIFHRYVPGRSQLAKFTGSFGTPTANVRQRAGYFSSRNGLFLEYDGETLYIVRRTYTSGAVVDNRIARANWDDPMDGSGESGVNLDLTKTWLCWMDLEWLGVGRYRVGFANPSTGIFVTAHAEAGANVLTVPYMTTASLPVRYEIENTGAAAQVTMKWICYSVDTEGGDEANLPVQAVCDTALTPQAVPNGSFVPVIALRAKTTGPNAVPNRGQMLLQTVQAISLGTNSVMWRLVLNPTTLTDNGGAVSWTAVGSLGEYAAVFTDGASDTIAGGTNILTWFTASGRAASVGGGSDIIRRLPLVYTELGSVQDTVVVVAAGLGLAASCYASMLWMELL